MTLTKKANTLLPIARKKSPKFVKPLVKTLQAMRDVMAATKTGKPNRKKLEDIVKAHEVEILKIAMILLGTEGSKQVSFS